MNTTLNRILANGVMILGLGFLSVGFVGVHRSDATAQSGTIKVHAEASCSGADNDPKPGEQFWVSGTGFDDDVARWLAVTNGTNAHDPIVIGPVSVGSSGTFCAGPFTLTAGHYKVYVGRSSEVVTNSEKTKVFKVESVPVTEPSTTTPVTEPPTTPPVTEPPTTPPVTEPPVTTIPDTTAPDTTAPVVTEAPTTTDEASGGPTTSVEGESGGPTTTRPGSSLPTTGGSPTLLILGVALAGFGLTLRALALRRS